MTLHCSSTTRRAPPSWTSTPSCGALQNEHGLHLVVIDYLQLMSGRGRSENRNQEISAISRGLKLLAKELNAPMLVLSQLSRAPETRARAITGRS